jgi:c-di-GMP-binding flagellar brake protein YcgR
MTEAADLVERREHKRFHLSNRALVVLRPYYTKLGRVVDVSAGGLSFTYLESNQSSQESFELDVLSEDFTARVREIPFEVVSEQDEKKAPFSAGSTTMKRCGVKFSSLTEIQRSLLKSFIEDHTIPEA